MTAREYFCSAREAVKLITEYDSRERSELSKAGIRARSMSPRFQVGTPTDPMRHVDRAVDMQSERHKELKSAFVQVAEAWQVVIGIGELFGGDKAKAVADRFLKVMTWQQVADDLGTTRTNAERIVDVTFDFVDSEGIARVREGRRKWTGAE